MRNTRSDEAMASSTYSTPRKLRFRGNDSTHGSRIEEVVDDDNVSSGGHPMRFPIVNFNSNNNANNRQPEASERKSMEIL